MGLALGALSPEQLRARTARYYAGGQGGDFIDYAGSNHNRSGLVRWERDAVAAWFPPPPARVLVYGAGAGREVLALSGLGYDVRAFECHPDLVAAGNAILAEEQLACRIRLLAEDRPPPPDSTQCDAVLIGWSAFTHVQSRAARVELLRGLRAVALPHAPLLLSFFVRTNERFRFDIAARVGSRLRRLRGLQPVEVGDILAHTYIHMFSQRSVADELRAGGWEPVMFAADDVAHAIARRGAVATVGESEL
jgi:hypothetical protein